MPRGRNVHIPYIKITFRDISLTWRYDENRPDYFTSLFHKRTNDHAGQLSVNITYAPKIGENPNKIEEAVTRSNGECLVQYGDLNSWSPMFKAMVVQYSVKFQDGVLLYSFTLVSESVTYNFDTPGPFSLDDKGTIEDVKDKIREVVSQKMGPDGNLHGYVLEESSLSVLSQAKFNTTSVTVGGGQSPIKFVVDLLKQLRPKDDSSQCYYTLEVDDSYWDGPGHLRVVKIDPDACNVTYKFEWGTRDGTVLSWAPKYEGQYAIFNSRAKTIKGAAVAVYNSETGKLDSYKADKAAEMGSFATAGDLSQVNTAVKSTSDFVELADYAYQATLEVLGEGKKVHIGSTVIEVVPMIRNQPHWSQGQYIVKGVTDSVSGDGFTTTFDLMRKTKDWEKPTPAEGQDSVWVNGTWVPLSDYNPVKS